MESSPSAEKGDLLVFSDAIGDLEQLGDRPFLQSRLIWWIHRHGQDATGRIVTDRPGMLTDPHLAPLRGDPRFETIVARAL